MTTFAEHPGLLVGIVLGAGAAVALVRGIALGYPRAVLADSVLSAKEQAIVAASADTLFPAGGTLPLSGTQAGVVAFFDGMMRRVPAQNRLLIRALLRFLEHGPWLFDRRSRLTSQAPSARVATLRAWSESRVYLLRVAFLSIRTLLAMAYMENPAVASRIGHHADLDPFARQAQPGRATA